MWFNLARSAFEWRDSSRRAAFQGRDRLEARLTPAQLREAQQLAREWWEPRAR